MKTKLLITLMAAIAVALFAAACQRQASDEAASKPHDGHDMSNMNHDMSGMQGHDMMNMNSDPGAAEAPYDLQFLDSMMHHHAGAIMMAQMVLGKTDRPELKAFAQKIIDDQTKEKEYFQQLRSQWYAGRPSAVNMEMPGMEGGMKIMTSDHMKDMDEMEPKHFDDHFLNMMTAHHEGAVVMAKEALQKAEHAEIKETARQIISEQQKEIDQMKKWKEVWGNH